MHQEQRVSQSEHSVRLEDRQNHQENMASEPPFDVERVSEELEPSHQRENSNPQNFQKQTQQHPEGFQEKLTNEQWDLLSPIFPPKKHFGRKRTTEFRDVVNAILFRHYEECSWRKLPQEFPPWMTVYTYFQQWRKTGLLQEIFEKLGIPVSREEGSKSAQKKRSSRD